MLPVDQTQPWPTIDLTDRFIPFSFSQGPRPLCLAFATSSAHKIARGSVTDFSPEALWHFCHRNGYTQPEGTSFPAIAEAIGREGQPSLGAWPYNQALFHDTEDVPALAQKETWRTAVLSPVTLSPGAQTYLERTLTTGRAVVVAIEVSDEFTLVKGAEVVVVPDVIPEPQGVHAVLIVGAADDGRGGRIYRVLNSWGLDWADGGFTWLPALYLDKYAVGAAALTL
ncbi:C1 family peptidase [Paenarthrobacter nicotinovorans]|uniref:C1 family peptidase n=1 Tax=Paenarthrobacter nicotinovorans TaxID=29320 RepID=A0ABV0GSV5_PAENI